LSLKNKNIKILIILLGVLAIFSLGTLFGTNISDDNNKRELIDNINQIDGDLDEISLLRPSQSSTFLDEEAGISIYMDAGQVLDLDLAKSGFKSIEKETSNYVVGSISLPDRPESDDVHCFVHKDGWIVVYYLKSEPLCKIIDWDSYIGETLTKTKLQIGLEEICIMLFITPTIVKYYHFQYPIADKVMLIFETQIGLGTDSFNLKIPSELTLYERSWSHRAGPETLTKNGFLTFAQLSSGIFHTIEAYAYASGFYRNSALMIDGETISVIDTGYQGPEISEVGIGIVYKES